MKIDRRSLLWILRGSYGAIFVFAGLAKLFGDGKPVLDMLRGIGVLPGLAGGAVVALPWLELILGVWFFVNWKQRLRNLIACAGLSVFTLVLVLGARNGSKACGCFGSYFGESIQSAIARDIVFILGTLFLLTLQSGPSRNRSAR